MQTLNDITETELNVTLAESQDIETAETMDVEVVSHKWTRQSFNAYRSKLRLMDTIHNEIAGKVNAQREATFKAFFRPEDNFIPESNHNDHFGLWLATQANPMPNLP